MELWAWKKTAKEILQHLPKGADAIAALRHAIDGGPAGTVVTGALALLGYGLTALALTVANEERQDEILRRERRFALHPA